MRREAISATTGAIAGTLFGAITAGVGMLPPEKVATESDCSRPRIGDCNGDGVVDLFDIDAFGKLLADPCAWAELYPEASQMAVLTNWEYAEVPGLVVPSFLDDAPVGQTWWIRHDDIRLNYDVCIGGNMAPLCVIAYPPTIADDLMPYFPNMTIYDAGSEPAQYRNPNRIGE